MDIDSDGSGTGIEVAWTGGDPPYNNISITEPKRCRNALCSRYAAFGSDYCKKHRSSFLEDVDRDIPNIQNSNPSGPSNRDLQRQLDRLEGKLDAILAALGGD